MPLQNRVTPFGALQATPARGAWMGNRGILHDVQQHIVAPWRHKAWVTCRLHYKGRHREVFTPRNYSELFFLDEATAFAAGHRPCGECRHERFNEFKAAWRAAAGLAGNGRLAIGVIDEQLHRERALRGGGKLTWEERWDHVPPGAFIAQQGRALLCWDGLLLPWSHHGYGAPAPLPAGHNLVTVLTPRSIVAMFRAGFRPQVHPSVAAARPLVRPLVRPLGSGT